jgi:hypothetical protein
MQTLQRSQEAITAASERVVLLCVCTLGEMGCVRGVRLHADLPTSPPPPLLVFTRAIITYLRVWFAFICAAGDTRTPLPQCLEIMAFLKGQFVQDMIGPQLSVSDEPRHRVYYDLQSFPGWGVGVTDCACTCQDAPGSCLYKLRRKEWLCMVP